MSSQLPVAGEKEPTRGQEEDPSRAPQIPVQEGRPQSQAPRRKRRTQKPPQAVALNPDCSNPACIVTCSPQCENLHDWVDYTEYRRAEREHEMGNDPTLRSKDVI